MAQGIDRFLDESGKIKQMPAKHLVKLMVFEYLAGKFEYEKEYSEQEVNAIISTWHAFGDYFLLRRGLVDNGWLLRLPDGSKYWKNKEKQEMKQADEC
ncbi:MAG TPA: DUF2087 domain-containing protein [Syntrophomonadaceae bacterium]|nr:DUF2087 domain-containing protein [Syntrophomonadaceae bacterium]